MAIDPNGYPHLSDCRSTDAPFSLVSVGMARLQLEGVQRLARRNRRKTSHGAVTLRISRCRSTALGVRTSPTAAIAIMGRADGYRDASGWHLETLDSQGWGSRPCNSPSTASTGRI